MVTGSVHLLEQLHDYLQHGHGYAYPAKPCNIGNSPPVVIALHPGINTFNLPGTISRLLKIPPVFSGSPFGWEITPTFKLHLCVRNDLWDETCILALKGQQIQPFFIEVTGITG